MIKKLITILLFLFTISCTIDTDTFVVSGKIFYFLPVVFNKYNHVKVYLETEGAWNRVGEYYPDLEMLKVRLNADRLENLGWETYFDPKIGGFDRKLFVEFHGAYSKWVQPTCGPIPHWYWDAWVDEFVIPGISHIGAERISYAEIGNEPDTSYSGAYAYFGCWGEDYASGVYFAQFVNHVYGRIKVLYPNITILSSGFMNQDTEFLRGFRSVIQYTDGISLHDYPYCSQDFTKVQAKIDWFTDEFPEWPIYFSETSMIYPTQSSECDLQQAAYMTYLKNDLRGVPFAVWYTAGCNSWMNSDLIYPCSPINLKPAYYAYIGLLKAMMKEIMK